MAGLGVSPGQVALAWVLHRGILPLLGPRTLEQLLDNLGAADIVLPDEHIQRLEEASAIALGFPHEMNARAGTRNMLAGGAADLVDLLTYLPR